MIGEVLFDEVVWLEVMDDGVGIVREYLVWFFELFFIICGGLGGKGIGLGLVIVVGIVIEYDGGVVVLISYEGMVFCLLLLVEL